MSRVLGTIKFREGSAEWFRPVVEIVSLDSGKELGTKNSSEDQHRLSHISVERRPETHR